MKIPRARYLCPKDCFEAAPGLSREHAVIEDACGMDNAADRNAAIDDTFKHVFNDVPPRYVALQDIHMRTRHSHRVDPPCRIGSGQTAANESQMTRPLVRHPFGG